MTSEIDIGSRLRFIREKSGLSQRELAKRTGVTNATISLIEANQTNPSVGALKRILDGLPIGHESNFISLNGAVSIPRNSFTRADAVCVVGEIEDVLGRAVALGGCAAELAAVLPLHTPEQLRPVRVKRRVTAAVVLEVDAVDGGQQVAPPAVFVGVLVQFAIAALVLL